MNNKKDNEVRQAEGLLKLLVYSSLTIISVISSIKIYDELIRDYGSLDKVYYSFIQNVNDTKWENLRGQY